MSYKSKSNIIYWWYVFLFLTSCTIEQRINLNEDGSANVRSSFDEEDQVLNFYKSDQIFNLSANDKEGIIFTIKTIDSLGNYLSPVFNKDFFQFKYNHDSLLILDGSGTAIRDNRKCCIYSIIEITSQKKIKSVYTKNKYVNKDDDRVIIRRSRRSFKSNDLNVVIVFDK